MDRPPSSHTSSSLTARTRNGKAVDDLAPLEESFHSSSFALLPSALTPSRAPSNALIASFQPRFPEGPVLLDFPFGWAKGPVMDWYNSHKSQGSTIIDRMQLRRDLQHPYYHEYIVVFVRGGHAYRIDRRPDRSAPFDTIMKRGCKAYDTVEAVGQRSLKRLETMSDCVVELHWKNTQILDLLLVLAICFAIREDKFAKRYTLQRYNCYFLSWTIVMIALRNTVAWGVRLSQLGGRLSLVLDGSLWQGAQEHWDRKSWTLEVGLVGLVGLVGQAERDVKHWKAGERELGLRELGMQEFGQLGEDLQDAQRKLKRREQLQQRLLALVLREDLRLQEQQRRWELRLLQEKRRLGDLRRLRELHQKLELGQKLGLRELGLLELHCEHEHWREHQQRCEWLRELLREQKWREMGWDQKWREQREAQAQAMGQENTQGREREQEKAQGQQRDHGQAWGREQGQLAERDALFSVSLRDKCPHPMSPDRYKVTPGELVEHMMKVLANHAVRVANWRLGPRQVQLEMLHGMRRTWVFLSQQSLGVCQ